MTEISYEMKAFVVICFLACIGFGYYYFQQQEKTQPTAILQPNSSNVVDQKKNIDASVKLTNTTSNNPPQSKPKSNGSAIFRLTDITIADNDKRGAFIEISESDDLDFSHAFQRRGLNIGEKLLIKNSTFMKLEKINAGCTLNDVWIQISIEGTRYILNEGNTYTYGNQIFRFTSTTLDTSNVSAYVDVVDDNNYIAQRYFLNKGDDFFFKGKKFTIKNIYDGLTLNSKAILVSFGDYEKVIDLGEQTGVPGTNYYIRLNDILLKSVAETMKNNPTISIAEANQKTPLPFNPNNRKAIIQIYDTNRTLIDQLTLADGAKKEINNMSIKLISHYASSDIDTLSATFDLNGRRTTLKIGQEEEITGKGFVKLQDISVVISNQYASLDYLEDGAPYKLQLANRDSLQLKNGKIMEIIDIAPGMTLNAKFVKIKIGDKIRAISVGEYLCSNYSVVADITNC